MTTSQQKNIPEVIGLSASGVCLIHCLAMPLILPVLAASSLLFIMNDWIEVSMMALSLVLAVYSITHSFILKHGNAGPFLLIAVSLGLFINRNTFGADYHTGIVMTASFCVALGFLFNSHLCRSCPVCQKRKKHHDSSRNLA